jgi:excisionase family DNA binding protein
MANTAKVSRGYFKVSELALYSGISERTLWDLLYSPVNPIPHHRVGPAGRIVRIRKNDFDEWMDQHRDSDADVDGILNDLFRD